MIPNVARMRGKFYSKASVGTSSYSNHFSVPSIAAAAAEAQPRCPCHYLQKGRQRGAARCGAANARFRARTISDESTTPTRRTSTGRAEAKASRAGQSCPSCARTAAVERHQAGTPLSASTDGRAAQGRSRAHLPMVAARRAHHTFVAAHPPGFCADGVSEAAGGALSRVGRAAGAFHTCHIDVCARLSAGGGGKGTWAE